MPLDKLNSNFVSGSRTHRGKVRENNEDSYFVDDKLGLFIVADGMGGQNAGEIASRLAVDVVSQYLKEKLPMKLTQDQHNLQHVKFWKYVMTSLINANQKVVNYSLTDECFHGMGTTIVLAICFYDVYHIFNVGDSRAYYWKPENLELTMVTKEHTLENKLLTEGYGRKAIDPRYKHILTHWIGSPKIHIDSIDTKKGTWVKDDCLLLCSDGLPNMLSNNEICSIIEGNAKQGPQRVCDVLVERGINKGGYDNITTIFIQNKN